MELNIELQTRPVPVQAPEPDRMSHTSTERFAVNWARGPCEVREAQRLRYRVFADEMGARLPCSPGSPRGHDIDRFDAFCEHLLVRAVGADEHAGEVIGTYRVLSPQAARRAGGLYSETEFDLAAVRPLLANAVELGRSCVHPQWRCGGVVMALWGALGEFMLRHGLDTMIGCASVSLRDSGHGAASLWHRLRRTHLAPPHWQVTPRLALPVDTLRNDLVMETPPLIKGYLRCGARVLGPPAWDPVFSTADLPLLMRFDDLPERYRKHFLEK